jgi:dynein heavy chain
MAWPREALYSVAKRAFEVQVELEISEYVDALASLCNAIHHTVKEETTSFYVELKRFNYTTPTSYLELIKM